MKADSLSTKGGFRRERIGRVVDQDADFDLVGSLNDGHETFSQRQIVVLLHRHLDMLVAQHRQRPGDAPPCRVRHDDVVDIAALGGDEGRQEPVLIFPGARGDLVGVADSLRKMISTAPLAPITAICAVGQA